MNKTIEQTVGILTEKIEELKSRIETLEKGKEKQEKETKHIFQEISIKTEGMFEKFEGIVSRKETTQTLIDKIKKLLHI